mgnify:CR=1 FL=1
MNTNRIGMPAALVIAALVAAGCANVPVTGRSQLNLVSTGKLAAMAADDYQTLLKEKPLSQDRDKIETLRRCGGRIRTAAEDFLRERGAAGELEHYAWEFNLIEAPDTINAFCMPGGKIAFYSGIWPVARDETGIAVIMGHEVAHALARHGNERMSQLLLVELGGQALDAALEEQSELTRKLALAAFGLGAQVGYVLPYSRKHEYEADRIGLLLMARAGYDPRAATAFWERMHAQGGQRPPEYLSTHPAPEARQKALEDALAEALKEYREP